MNMLPLFEEIQEQSEADQKRIDEILKTPVDCFFCGERMYPPTVMVFNHGIVFNGWCVKALMYHARAKHLHTVEAEWLQKKGIAWDKSRFDESQWHHENIEKHYKGHYGQCYGAECRGAE